MSLYLDTSVIVPLIVEDAHMAAARSLFRPNDPLPSVSDFALAEVAAVMGRLVRTRELAVDEAKAALHLLDQWVATRANASTLSPGDVATAGIWLRRFDLSLRTPDALHIAMAQRLGLTIATFDRGMATAARSLGIEVAGA